jgi:hypothetical protein
MDVALTSPAMQSISAAVLGSQIRTVLSCEHVATRFPSGRSATPVIGPVWSRKVATGWPLLTDHDSASPSTEPVTKPGWICR